MTGSYTVDIPFSKSSEVVPIVSNCGLCNMETSSKQVNAPGTYSSDEGRIGYLQLTMHAFTTPGYAHNEGNSEKALKQRPFLCPCPRTPVASHHLLTRPLPRCRS
jgi:hypothetical protein